MLNELLKAISSQYRVNSEIPPVVMLDDYFRGNSDQESIAPNQWGYGRPSVQEMYKMFQKIQARPEVQAVLVGLHPDWVESLEDETLWPFAENIHIYTTASEVEVEEWIGGMKADGVIEGWPYGTHPAAPQPKTGYRVLTVCWD